MYPILQYHLRAILYVREVRTHCSTIPVSYRSNCERSEPTY
jgi:hypothetical protein